MATELTTEEKRDHLLLAKAAVKTAVVLTEQALGANAAFEIFSRHAGLLTIDAIGEEIWQLDRAMARQGGRTA